MARTLPTLGLLATVAWARPVGATPTLGAQEPPPDTCAGPPELRAPDPRCGDRLDGRDPPGDGGIARTAPRAVLWVPRGLSRLVFWPVTESSDFLEHHRVQSWMEAILTTDDGLIGVRPVLDYSTSFVSTAGLRFFHRRLPDPVREVAARLRTAGPAVVTADVNLASSSWLGLDLHAGWDHRNDRLFSGIGPNSRADLNAQGRDLARFGSDVLIGEVRWAHRLPGRLVAGVHADLQRRDYRSTNLSTGPSIATAFGVTSPSCDPAAPSNGCVDPALVPGFGPGLRIGHAGATVAWDLRSHARDGGGLSIALDATHGQGIAGDPTRNERLSGELVLALPGLDRALILRGRAAMVANLASTPVPFEELVTPSGSAGMRGFPEGRFRGASGVVGTAEYRWYIAHNLDASLFSDVGTVAGPGFSGLRRDRWFPSFGIGFRLFNLDGPYWMAAVQTGAQIVYAPDAGFRFLAAVAPF